VRGPGEVVTLAVERLNASEFDGFSELLADDVVMMSSMAKLMGKAQVLAGLRENLGMASEHWRTVERLLVSGDHVATWLLNGGVVAESGNRWEMESCGIWKVRDGLIESIQDYADWRPLLAAFGVASD
jgi:ketosteroid isomerase-like protein